MSVYILIAIVILFFFGVHAMRGLYTELPLHVSVTRHCYSEILSAVYLVSFNWFCDFGDGLHVIIIVVGLS